MSRHPALTYDAKWTRFVRMWRDVMRWHWTVTRPGGQWAWFE